MRWVTLLILVAPLGPGNGALSQDAVKKELQEFQGFWKAVSIQHADGTGGSADEVLNTRLAAEGNKFTLTGKNYTITGIFSVNPASLPKAIDVVLTSQEGRETKFLGIYQVKGDTRKSCFALPEKERPRQFSSEQGYFGFEWRRK